MPSSLARVAGSLRGSLYSRARMVSGKPKESIRRVLAHARRTLGIVAEVDRRLLIGLIATQIFDAVSLVAMAWVGKQIIDSIVASLRDPARPVRAALTWVAIELGIVLLRSLVSQLESFSRMVLRSKLGLHVNMQ